MADLANNTEVKGKDYGPGGVSNRPFGGRFMNVVNASGYTIFLPENSTAEKNAMYSYLNNAPGVTVYKGKYAWEGILHDPKATIGLPGGSPCWSPWTPSASYRTPAACASGFTDQGVTNVQNSNPNSPAMANYSSIWHGYTAWEFYQDKPYGCPAGYYPNISVRRCAR